MQEFVSGALLEALRAQKMCLVATNVVNSYRRPILIRCGFGALCVSPQCVQVHKVCVIFSLSSVYSREI